MGTKIIDLDGISELKEDDVLYVVSDDESKQIKVENILNMKTGSVDLKSPQIKLTSEEHIEFSAEENVKFKGKDTVAFSGEDITLEADSELTLKSETLEVESNEINIKATNSELNIEAEDDNINIKSACSVEIQGEDGATINSLKVNVRGSDHTLFNAVTDEPEDKLFKNNGDTIFYFEEDDGKRGSADRMRFKTMFKDELRIGEVGTLD